MRTTPQVQLRRFFARHPVFSLDELASAMAQRRRRSLVERLDYHVSTGRLKRVAREIYAVAPEGYSASEFEPDAYLVAAAVRPDAIFCGHSALELLGVAHSAWHECTVFTQRRRPPLQVGSARIQFLEYPAPVRDEDVRSVGTRRVEWSGVLLRTTGPERTLVEGFRRLDLVGGLEELTSSAMAFPYLDFVVLEEVLRHYDTAQLWAAVGWFLETHAAQFSVPEPFLEAAQEQCPAAPQYLVRNTRGGRLVRRWNLIVPETAAGG